MQKKNYFAGINMIQIMFKMSRIRLRNTHIMQVCTVIEEWKI